MIKINFGTKAVIFTALVIFTIKLAGQELQDANWLFNHPAYKDSTSSEIIIASQIIDFSKNRFDLRVEEAKYSISTTVASVSNNKGELLFYTNGCQVLQADHQLMENGDSLNFGKYYVEWWQNCKDGYNGMQDILILNDPSHEYGYYIIHKTINYILIPTRFYVEGIKYSYVDMTMNNGKGKVTIKNKIIHEDTYVCSSFLSAVHHTNGKDWWLIQMEEYDNTYYKVLIDENGAAVKDSQDIGQKTTRNTSAGGMSKFSPDGKKWAWYTWENGLNLFDFDRQTGQLSNHKTKIVPFGIRKVFTGLEFSPNGRFVYISTVDTLLQVDLWKEDLPYEVIGTYDGFQNPFSTDFILMNLAPDCKIYMNSSSSTKSMHLINYPNKKGKACDFQQHAIDLFYTNGVLNLPNFPRLRVDEEDLCDTLELYTDVKDVFQNQSDLKIYPNPIIDVAKIEAEISGFLFIYDLRGELVKRQKIKQGDNFLDLEHQATGVYSVVFINDKGISSSIKIVKGI
ncbi:MAG: T9SS type A sorting domain-containing protein [Saprospiraceae bacterium]|nr:T9SS type A sorting domain-containing protein [Saprospiraceae bacterium]